MPLRTVQRISPRDSRPRRGIRTGAVVLTAAALSATGLLAAPAQAAPSADAAHSTTTLADLTARKALTSAEIARYVVTNTAAGKAALAAERHAGSAGVAVDRRPTTVYQFGAERWVMPTAHPLTVIRGLDRTGHEAFVVIPQGRAAAIRGLAGFAVPPKAAFVYNNDSTFSNTIGTWKRTVWWTITKANDWKPCSTCSANDYYRMYGKMQAATLTGSTSTQGFKRAWIEFDRTSTTSVSEFEVGKPAESYGGSGTFTETIGFGSSVGITLGEAPVQVTAQVDNSYQGSITKSTENWHPVIRSESGSGGVQWCRYETAEFTGTKYVTTRVSVQNAPTAAGPGWNILTGQQDVTTSCPTQI